MQVTLLMAERTACMIVLCWPWPAPIAGCLEGMHVANLLCRLAAELRGFSVAFKAPQPFRMLLPSPNDGRAYELTHACRQGAMAAMQPLAVGGLHISFELQLLGATCTVQLPTLRLAGPSDGEPAFFAPCHVFSSSSSTTRSADEERFPALCRQGTCSAAGNRH